MSDLTKPAPPTEPPQPLDLRTLTPARVSLTRTGSSIATRDALDFTLAHAQARDAVHATLSIPSLLEALRNRDLETLTLQSAAPDRATYLRRPDLGRTLSPASAAKLTSNSRQLAIILADGLSALAVDRHAIPLLDALLPHLATFTLAPILIAEQARVALGDPIGQLLNAQLTLMLIGERPGLSSPDSLGAYVTWNPRPGRTDAERNCISNIRTAGLDYATAATRIAWLCHEARRLQLSGIPIKEQQPPAPPSLSE
jgi:ethanolamine ammonia-lyase small subunit